MALESMYEYLGSSDLGWFSKANDFRGAVAAIWHTIHNDPPEVRNLCNFDNGYRFDIALPMVFALNAGLSLELLLKAIIVLNKNGKFKNSPHTHNLIKLADEANILRHLTENQKATLNIFSEAVFWRAKYPVPKKEDEYERSSEIWKKMRRPSRTSKLSITEANPDTWPNLDNYNALWDLICNIYFEQRDKNEPRIK